jgi:hypothetical protein
MFFVCFSFFFFWCTQQQHCYAYRGESERGGEHLAWILFSPWYCSGGSPTAPHHTFCQHRLRGDNVQSIPIKMRQSCSIKSSPYQSSRPRRLTGESLSTDWYLVSFRPNIRWLLGFLYVVTKKIYLHWAVCPIVQFIVNHFTVLLVPGRVNCCLSSPA